MIVLAAIIIACAMQPSIAAEFFDHIVDWLKGLWTKKEKKDD